MKAHPTSFSVRHRSYSPALQKLMTNLGVRESKLPSTEDQPALSLKAIQQFLDEDQQNQGSSEILLDNYGRNHTYLRISLTERCNLRCTYCMPEDGIELTPTSSLLTTEEIIKLSQMFAEAGVEKIRFTGGEPTVRKDIEDIVREVAGISGIKAVGITTNGIVLPRKLAGLKKAGLTHLNISLDTLIPEKFAQITRRNGFDRVMQSIDMAVDMGFDPLKINCVVMRGMNETEVLDFVEFTREKPIDVRFIEYMPFDGNAWKDSKMVSYQELLDSITGKYPSFSRLSDSPNDTSKGWHVPGHKGKVSFITSMSEHFCGTCNRIRMTADGNLKVCLFGSAEVSLRDAMRNHFTDEQLKKIISLAIRRKKEHHAGMYNIASMKNRPMILIGG